MQSGCGFNLRISVLFDALDQVIYHTIREICFPCHIQIYIFFSDTGVHVLLENRACYKMYTDRLALLWISSKSITARHDEIQTWKLKFQTSKFKSEDNLVCLSEPLRKNDIDFKNESYTCTNMMGGATYFLQTVHSKQANRALKRKELLKRKKKEE